MSTVSFAKVSSGAPATTSSPVVPPAVPTPAENANLPATVPTRNVGGFSMGTEDEQDEDPGAGRVHRPYLNLVQPTSKEIKNVAAVGEFVLGKTIKIPSGNKVVVIGFGKTFYREKVKWGTEGRTAYSLEDVEKANGTISWRDSVENSRNNSGSNKPWFAPCIKALLLVECPPGADDAFFPHVVDGKAYASCLFEAKSIAYDSFYVELNSKRKTTNLFKGGWASRVISLTTVKGKGEDATYKPVPVVGEVASAEFLAIAKSITTQ